MSACSLKRPRRASTFPPCIPCKALPASESPAKANIRRWSFDILSYEKGCAGFCASNICWSNAMLSFAGADTGLWSGAVTGVAAGAVTGVTAGAAGWMPSASISVDVASAPTGTPFMSLLRATSLSMSSCVSRYGSMSISYPPYPNPVPTSPTPEST